MRRALAIVGIGVAALLGLYAAGRVGVQLYLEHSPAAAWALYQRQPLPDSGGGLEPTAEEIALVKEIAGEHFPAMEVERVFMHYVGQAQDDRDVSVMGVLRDNPDAHVSFHFLLTDGTLMGAFDILDETADGTQYAYYPDLLNDRPLDTQTTALLGQIAHDFPGSVIVGLFYEGTPPYPTSDGRHGAALTRAEAYPAEGGRGLYVEYVLSEGGWKVDNIDLRFE